MTAAAPGAPRAIISSVSLVPPPPPLHKARRKRASGLKDWALQVARYFVTACVLVLMGLGLVLMGMDVYDWFLEGPAKKAATERAYREPSVRPYNASPANVAVNPKDGLTYVRIPAGRFEFGCSLGG